MSELFRARAHHGALAGARVHLVGEGWRARVSPARARLAARLDRFAALADHAERLGVDPAEIAEDVAALRDRGALTTLDELHGGLLRGQTPAEVRLIGIPTRGRPRLLARALDSLMRFSGPPIVVIDTSEESPSLRSGRALHLRMADLEFLARRVGSMVGDERVARLALGLPRERGIQTGAAHNALLLLAAGSAHVAVDDDVSADAARLSQSGTWRFQRGDPTTWWPAPSVEAALERHPVAPFDVAGHLGEIAGAAAGDLITRADALLDARPMDDARLQRGRALVVRSGLCGHSGFGGLLPLLSVSAEVAERLAPTDAEFAAHAESGAMCRAATNPALTSTPGLQTAACAIDARELVPPFPPFGRASDALWGAALRAVRQDALVAWLPWAAAHRPEPLRRGDPSTLAVQALELSLRDLLAHALSETSFSDPEPAARLRAFASILLERASFEEGQWGEWLLEVCERALSQLLAAAERDLPGCKAWQRLRRTTANALSAALEQRPQPPVSDDARQRMADYGRVLGAWPELFSSAMRHELLHELSAKVRND